MITENIEYRLGKTGSGKYQQLACATDSSVIVRELSMYGFGDCVSFFKKRSDTSSYGSSWGLYSLACFCELQNYTRLIDVPQEGIEKLAARMYELLYLERRGEERYKIIPLIDPLQPEYGQITEELNILQGTQRDLMAKRKIRFPKISADELRCADLW